MKMDGIKILTLLSVLVGAGCAGPPLPPKIEYRTITVPAELIPPEPKLESIDRQELPRSCVSDATYGKLVRNHRKLKAYGAELRGLLVR